MAGLLMAPTKTDAGANEWLITDEPTQFRLWGNRVTYPLPPAEAGPDDGGWTIGAAEDCWLQLQDTSARVSRRHPPLTDEHQPRRWTIPDLRSKNGVTQGGARQLSFLITPGVEVGIGGVTLIAESPMLRALRE